MLRRKEVCCKRMWLEMKAFYSKKLNKDGTLDTGILYEEDTRTYILLHLKRPDDWTGSPIEYCPFCGAKLPSSLEPEDTIMKEYGEDYVRYNFEPEYKSLSKKIRKEFDTDKWWKKRGL